MMKITKIIRNFATVFKTSVNMMINIPDMSRYVIDNVKKLGK